MPPSVEPSRTRLRLTGLSQPCCCKTCATPSERSSDARLHRHRRPVPLARDRRQHDDLRRGGRRARPVAAVSGRRAPGRRPGNLPSRQHPRERPVLQEHARLEGAQHGLTTVAGVQYRSLVLADGGGEPDRASGASISPGIVRDARGTPRTAGRLRRRTIVPRAEPVVILGDEIFQRRYRGDPSIVGKRVLVNARPHSRRRHAAELRIPETRSSTPSPFRPRSARTERMSVPRASRTATIEQRRRRAHGDRRAALARRPWTTTAGAPSCSRSARSSFQTTSS